MKIGVTDEAVIQGLPGGGAITNTLRNLNAGVSASFHQEHTVDDHHGTIHASGSVAERGRSVAMGDKIPTWFQPLDYTAKGAMTWTVTQVNVYDSALESLGRVYYTLVGMWMWLNLAVTASTVGGVVDTALYYQIPDGWRAAAYATAPCHLLDNGVLAPALFTVTTNARVVTVTRADGAAFTASAGLTTVLGQLHFPITTG